ncbi:hypothetical protein [Streptomyces longisporoflavus]|uniref:Transmembrane transport protein n=1 Tax=Streptomyces longisporoflavus TaxID=28044 RepID=A0ABW7QZE5_9ACTN
MTTLTTAPARTEDRRSALALPGVYRAMLLQHRTALWITLALLALGIAVLVTNRLMASHAADVFTATGCTIGTNTTPDCHQTVREYLDTEIQFNRSVDYSGMAILALPCLIGLFVAGPLIGRDMETGTYKLAWTQSVSPVRWLAMRLSTYAALVVFGVTLLAAVQRWVWSTGPRENYGQASWYARAIYGSVGPVALAYALFGLGVGALAGVLLRRMLPAMAAALAVTVGAVAALPLLRGRLWATETVTSSGSYAAGPPASGFGVEQGMTTADGRLPESVCSNAIGNYKQCLDKHQVTGWYNDFHPSSHFWPLQFVETGIVLALAAVATYAAFRVLRRRTA